MKSSKSEVIYSTNDKLIEVFKKTWKKDPIAARVASMLKNISQTKVIVYYQTPEKFQVVEWEISYGVSVTKKLYVRRRRAEVIFVKGSLVWTKSRKQGLKSTVPMNLRREVKSLLKKKIPLYEEIEELGVSFNWVANRNIKTKAAFLRAVIGAGKSSRFVSKKFELWLWKKIRTNLANTEKLRKENIEDSRLLEEVAHMAGLIGEKLDISLPKSLFDKRCREIWEKAFTEVAKISPEGAMSLTSKDIVYDESKIEKGPFRKKLNGATFVNSF